MNHGKISKELAAGLLELRARIQASEIPSSKIDETLNIATWNIRAFGKKPRSEKAIHYIAEILGQFDVISIIELQDDLSDLARVLPILGPYWRAVFSDAMSDPGGNQERIGFIYDKRAVSFQGLAAEASPPRNKRGEEYLPEISWWRSPYMASFRAGNFDFVMLAVHIRWGDSVSARQAELQSIADWIDGKRRNKNCEDKDLIVLGDFNIGSRTDKLFAAITSKGLKIPDALLQKDFGSNLEKDKRYDQILHHPIYKASFTNAGGVLDFYTGGIDGLFKGLTKAKFTFELSDHLPLWIQINTDTDDMKLDQIIRSKD
jgi:hypothetical protein